MPAKMQPMAGWSNYLDSQCEPVSAVNIAQVKQALSEPNLIFRGLGRSYGDPATNANNRVLLCQRFDQYIAFDEPSGLLHCQAGVGLERILWDFGPRGWLPTVTPGTKFVTIGGCISNDVHGKGHHVDGSFYNTVEEVTLMLVSGEIVTVSRQQQSDLFEALFGGMGLLGFIISAKIRLRKVETTYYQQKTLQVENLSELLDAFDEYDSQYHYQIAWVDSLATGSKLGRGVCGFANHVTGEQLPARLQKNPLKVHSKARLSVPFNLPGFCLNQFTVTILNKVLDFVQANAADYVHYENLLFPLDAILNWNRGYGKRGFIQYQFVIPLEDGRKNIESILKTISSSGMSPFLNVLKKFGKGHGDLSFPMEGYTFAIDFPYHRDLPSFTARLDAQVLDYGGRLYLGKDCMLNADMFKQMYPQHKQWLAIKNKVDPEHLLQSDMSRRIGLTG